MTCAKQVVRATIVTPAGNVYTGENDCLNPQLFCPRAGMPSGVGYALCTHVCQQTAHAEVNALKAAGREAAGATLYLEGHTYCCHSCLVAATSYGIAEVVIGSPPTKKEVQYECTCKG